MNVPAKVPFEVGLKTMLLLQLAPAASVVPHPKAEIAKGDEAPAPFTVMAELVPLVRTRVCGELVVPTACEPKFRLAGESVTPVVELAPVPVREVDCVPAESVTARLPVRVPLAVGVNVTETEQLAPAARLVPHPLPATWKSPEVVTEVIEIDDAVPLVSVALCAALVVPTVWLAKVRLEGDSVTEPPVVVPPVPVRETF